MLNDIYHQAAIVPLAFNSFHAKHQPRRSQSIPCKYYQHLSSLLLRRTARHALELARVLPRHARLVPGAFAAFPEAVAFLADETGVAEAAVFGTVVLFAGACGKMKLSVGWVAAWYVFPSPRRELKGEHLGSVMGGMELTEAAVREC